MIVTCAKSIARKLQSSIVASNELFLYTKRAASDPEGQLATDLYQSRNIILRYFRFVRTAWDTFIIFLKYKKKLN